MMGSRLSARSRVVTASLAVVGMTGLVALPADAAPVALPVDLTGGGPGGSEWVDF